MSKTAAKVAKIPTTLKIFLACFLFFLIMKTVQK